MANGWPLLLSVMTGNHTCGWPRSTGALPHGKLPLLPTSSPQCSVVLGISFFRPRKGRFNFLYRVNPDGTGRQKVLSEPVLDTPRVSPDGQWVVVRVAAPGEESPTRFVAYPLRGGPADSHRVRDDLHLVLVYR